MPSLSTLPKGDSAWLLRKSIERIMQQVSVLETNIGSSTTGNSSNGQVIFNDNGTLRGDADMTFNTALNRLIVSSLEISTTATITGNLTVDTNTLFVDAANNCVGVGTTTPTVYANYKTLALVGGSSGFVIDASATGGGAAGGMQIAVTPTGTNFDVFGPNAGTAAPAVIRTGTFGSVSERYRIAGDGVATWSNVGGVAGTAMTLNSTGLGVGVTPSAKLHVEGGGAQARFSIASASDARHEYFRNSIREALIGWDANLFQILATQATGELAFGSGNTIRVRINSAGDMISNVTSIAPTLATNNQMVFNLTSNTNLRISVRGSDGVTRVANITLA